LEFSSSITVSAVDKATFPEYQTQYGQGYLGNVFATYQEVQEHYLGTMHLMVPLMIRIYWFGNTTHLFPIHKIMVKRHHG
jgi:hypothetical protein